MVAIDPTVFTEDDIPGRISTDATTVTIASMDSADDCFLYYDFAASTFADITVQATMRHTSGSSVWGWFIGMSNTLGNQNDFDTANDGITLGLFRALGTSNWYIYNHFAATSTTPGTSLGGSTDWYVTFSRTSTTMDLVVRSGSHLGTIVESQTLTVPSTAYRYLFFGQSHGTGTGTNLSYTLKDIDSDVYPPGNVLDCETGAFVVAGIATGLTAHRLVSATIGSYVESGIDAALISGSSSSYEIHCMPRAFEVSGIDISTPSSAIPCDVGAFSVVSIATTFTVQHKLEAGMGQFSVFGPVNVIVPPPPTMPCETGVFVVTGVATTSINSRRVLTAAGRVYTITGKDIKTHNKMVCPTASFAIAGPSADLGEDTASLMIPYTYTLGA